MQSKERTSTSGTSRTSLSSPLVPRRTLKVINLWLSLLVILSMLISPFSSMPAAGAVSKNDLSHTTQSGSTTQASQAPQVPSDQSILASTAQTIAPTTDAWAPVVDPHLPGLVMQVGVTPHTIHVGDIFTVTLTLANQAPDPANNLIVTMPLPDGAVRLPSPTPTPATTSTSVALTHTGTPTMPAVSATPTTMAAPDAPDRRPDYKQSGSVPNVPKVPVPVPGSETPDATSTPTGTPTPIPTLTPDPNGWSWQQSQLDGGSTITMTAVGRLTQTPPGDALVVNADALASGLTTPAHDTGGAIVVDPTLGGATASYSPGTATTLQSGDNRVDVQIPANAFYQPLTFRHDFQPGTGHVTPSEIAGRKRGLGVFYLNAATAGGDVVHQFDAPLTMTVSYTPQQLQATGISEDDLTLFWYDESQFPNGKWVPVDTEVDSLHHTVTASTNHFSPWSLSDGSNPSAAFIPSLQGWQVGLYSGDVNYSYPIEVPAGPGGIKPNLQLSYSSSSTDGNTGTRAKQQSSWVGKGWSLDTGFIALNKLAGEDSRSRYYSLVFDGQSFDLMRGPVRWDRVPVDEYGNPIAPDLRNPTQWEWYPTNESFIRARAESMGDSTSTNGGFKGNNTPYPRYYWQVWAKNGTRYDFTVDMWQGFKDCENYNAFMETYKWYLYRVVSTNRNVITYNYDRHSQAVDAHCEGVHGTVDFAIQPTSITWGRNTNDTNDRYKVVFTTGARTIDLDVDHADNQLGEAPQEKWRLDKIGVFSKQANDWELIREYNLTYALSTDSLLSDTSLQSGSSYSGDTNYKKLTLTSIRMAGNDGIASTDIPALTFTYGSSNNARGTGYYANPDWNRLTSVNNGHGGTITFTYKNIGHYLEVDPGGVAPGIAAKFRNNRRVISKLVGDGMATCPNTEHCFTWSYDYSSGTPQYNSLGTTLEGNNQEGLNTYPNSAALYYNKYRYSNPNYESRLVHKKNTEFRGHSKVKETDPNNNATEHYFYQGDAYRAPSGSCTFPNDPNPLGGSTLVNNPCFQTMRNQEFLKGKEYQTITYDGGVSATSKLSQTDHTFTVNFLSDGADAYWNDALTGLWRAFSYESSTKDSSCSWDADYQVVVCLSTTTNYTYDVNNYGNLMSVEERDNGDAVLRRTEHTYGARVDGYSYIVDRVQQDNVKNGSGNWLAKTVYGYDGALGVGNPGIAGNLMLVRKYHDITTPLPATIHSSDTSYTYDQYGNPTSVTTYAHEGSLNTTTGVYSQPGGTNGASEGRTTITLYDTTFHAFPIIYRPPADQRGVVAAESADYDYHMGTLTSVTDANNQTTTATYDKFGRLAKLVKPGDSSSLPTVSAVYSDTTQPFAYMVKKRETTSPNAIRTMIQFYDGMGRQIQIKGESGANPADNETQNIVVDKQYDGMGNVTKQSQPRYVNQTGSAFYQYVTPPSTGINWTTTTYDGLGRPVTIQAPDVTGVRTTTNEYKIIAGRYTVATIDAKGHKTRQDSDEFGRLLVVREFTGSSPTWGSDTASTSYGYNALDLLIAVTDAGSPTHSTSIQYDSLGRKTSMSDPDMGSWTYHYDGNDGVNGLLTSQTDAMNQQISFTYDKLGRLIRKTYPDTQSTTNNYSTYVYDEPWSTNGMGHLSYAERRENNVITSSVRKKYTARGLESEVTYSVLGLTGSNCNGVADGCRAFQFTYDSADRLSYIIYPSNQLADAERVSYTYDAAWRQKTACSDIQDQGCYVDSAQYTALDQPDYIYLGNGLSQNYCYDSATQRLQSMRVGEAATDCTEEYTGDPFRRSYQYDKVGNVTSITNTLTSEIQGFVYDERDRLTNWTMRVGSTYSINDQYGYDAIGNITSKGAVGNPITYNYNSTSGGGPHAVSSRTQNGTTVGSYSYDGNGNMTAGDGRSYSWNAENQPAQIVNGNVTEDYAYNADGARVKRTVSGSGAANPGTTYYIGGMYEEEYPQGSTSSKVRNTYTLNGQVVAQNEWVSDPTTPTNTPVNTSTNTPTPTPTPSYTPTHTPTPTLTPSNTPTAEECSVIDKPHYLRASDRPGVNGGYLMEHGQAQGGVVVVASPNPVQWSSPAFSNVIFASGHYVLHVRLNPSPPNYSLGPDYGDSGHAQARSGSKDKSTGISSAGSAGNSGSPNANVGKGDRPADPTPTVTIQYKLEDVAMDGSNPTAIGTPVSRNYDKIDQAVNDSVTLASDNPERTLADDHRLRLTISVQTTGDSAFIYMADSFLATPPYTVGPCPTATPTETPTPAGAFHYFNPQTGAPSNGGKVQVGEKFVLDLMIDPAQYTVDSQQAYLQFDRSLLQNVSVSQSGCVASSTVTTDTTHFELVTQYDACNDPGDCLLRTLLYHSGEMAIASSTFGGGDCSPGCSGPPFRVARVAFCGTNPGETHIIWSFKPPERESKVVEYDSNGNNVAHQPSYVDYWLNIVGPMPTETPTPLTPLPTNTPTKTSTPTNTPTITPTPTPTALTKLVGHVTWQGIPQPIDTPNPRNEGMGITLTLRLGTNNDINYTGLTTDASGFFTVSVDGLANGTYNWRAKGLKNLATAGTVALTGASTTQQEMGEQRAGDAYTIGTGHNVVNSSDFTTLKATFGKALGQPGYDARADFNNSGNVDASDFSLLRSNFGSGGATPVRPIGPRSRQAGGPSRGLASASQDEHMYGYGYEQSDQAESAGTANSPSKSVVSPMSSREDQVGMNAHVDGTDATRHGPNSPDIVVVRTLVYFHADHLGSISLVTSAAATPTVVSQQEFDPWGKVRSGGVGQTKRNYTGQKLDDTGLLFYNARYYDPALARFLSADSIVPGGAGGEAKNSRLVVDFHEGSSMSLVNGQNIQILAKGFWFQLNGEDKKAQDPSGPDDAQALNRYSYVLNNPVHYTDPTGHGECWDKPGCGGVVYNNSKTGVYVYGNYIDKVTGEKKQGWVYIPPGSSSIEQGIYDADMVQAVPGGRLYDNQTMGNGCLPIWCVPHGPGHDSTEVYKINSGEAVVIEDRSLPDDPKHTVQTLRSTANYGGTMTCQLGIPCRLLYVAGLISESGWKGCADGANCRKDPYKYK